MLKEIKQPKENDLSPIQVFIIRQTKIPNPQITQNGIELERKLSEHKHFVMSLASNPKDSSVIASASLDGTVKLWNVNGVSSQMTLSGHASGVNAVAFYAGDRTLLLSGGDDKTVILWDYQVPLFSFPPNP